MVTEDCVALWQTAEPKHRAQVIDQHHPECGCERHSLRRPDFDPIDSGEVIARILTSPAGYDISTGEILTARLVAAYSSGISVVRQGASDDEIKLTVEQLTSGTAEPNTLVGASILQVGKIRSLGDGTQWFCVYDTDEGVKKHHADIVGTFPTGLNRSQEKKEKSRRRQSLKILFESHVYQAQTLDDLIRAFRALNAPEAPAVRMNSQEC